MKVLKILTLCMIFILLSCGNSKTENTSEKIIVATQGQHPLFSQIGADGHLKATILMFGKKSEDD